MSSLVFSPYSHSTSPADLHRLRRRFDSSHTAMAVVCGVRGPRPRFPRVWKSRKRIGTISKSQKLVDCVKGLSNVKEEVYGALDSFIAWELEFPLIVVKKALKTLEIQKEWKRIIQVFADMEELGVQPGQAIVRMVGDVFQKMGMLDKYDKFKKKYPPASWEHRYIKGKRIRIRVKGQHSLDGEADDCSFAQSTD